MKDTVEKMRFHQIGTMEEKGTRGDQLTWISPSHQPLDDLLRIFTYWPGVRESCSLLWALKAVITTANSGVSDTVITAVVSASDLVIFSFSSSAFSGLAGKVEEEVIFALSFSPIEAANENDWEAKLLAIGGSVWNENQWLEVL